MLTSVWLPVLACRTCATNVVPVSSLAAVANAMSSQAAMGCFTTRGVPSGPNTPMPLPSGLRWLCCIRLSGASNSQNVAATGRAPAFMPNNLHISG